MMGLEPTTFCMANASDRSLPFAPVRLNMLFAGLPSKLANASEPERTPNLAILATPGRPPKQGLDLATNPQTCAITSDESPALTLALSHSLHYV
jgi:hypothetical protein